VTHIDVLADVVGARDRAARRGGEGDVAIAHNRWSYSTPTDQFAAKRLDAVPTVPPQRVLVGLIDHDAAHQALVLVVVTAAPPFTYQRTYSRQADLAGEEAERADLALVGRAGREKNRLAFEPSGRPVALCFNAEHPVGGSGQR